MPERVYEVGDRVLISDDRFEPGTTTALTPMDIEEINSRHWLVRNYINVDMSKFEYLGRRRCSICRNAIVGQAFYVRGGSDSFYCFDCYEKSFFTCGRCEHSFPIQQRNMFRDTNYCPNCYRDIGKVHVNVKPPTEEMVKAAKFSADNVPMRLPELCILSKHPLQINIEDGYLGNILEWSENNKLKFAKRVYLFGLVNRPEYKVRIQNSRDAIQFRDVVEKHFPGLCWIDELYPDDEGICIGLDLDLREHYRDKIHVMLIELAGVKSEDIVPKATKASAKEKDFVGALNKRMEELVCVV